MQAGKLRHRIKVVSITEDNQDNDYNEPTQDDTNLKGEYWGSMEPLRGRELLVARQLFPEVTHVSMMRGDIDITVKDILLFDDRKFYIEAGLDSAERGISKEIYCKEIL